MTTPAFADPADAAAFAIYRQAQIDEYGTWEAIGDIRVDNATLAFTAGHPVPASIVQRQGWDKQEGIVRRVVPPPQPGVDRAEQLKLRRAQLEEEAAAIEAELAAAEGYGSKTIPQLREILADRGLPTSGNKTELLERLHAADEPAAESTDESPEE